MKSFTHCKFKDHLDEALHDHFVCGLKSKAIQKRLMTDGDLDLKCAMELAQGMKAVHRNVQVLKENSKPRLSNSSNGVPNGIEQVQE